MQQKFNAKCVRLFVTKCDGFIIILTVIKKDKYFITQCDSY